MNQRKTTDITLIGLCAAILCILAPISIPIPFSPVPITLGYFAVILTGMILGRRKAAICIIVYICIGIVGLPVFSNYGSGIHKVFGPSGGYIIGYIFMAWMIGYFAERFSGKAFINFLGILLGAFVCYGIGTIWLSFTLSLPFIEALLIGVVPFLPFDFIKFFLAILVCHPIRRRLIMQNLIEST